MFSLRYQQNDEWQVWSDPSQNGLIPETCTLDPEHNRAKRNWDISAFSEAPPPNKKLVLADALYSANHGCFLLKRYVVAAMAEAGLTGWLSTPASIRLRDGRVIDEYHEMRVAGFAGIAPPASGCKIAWRCSACGHREYAPGFRRDRAAASIAVPDRDFWVIWPNSRMIYCSKRARDMLERFDTNIFKFVDPSQETEPMIFLGDEPVPPFYSAAARAMIEEFWSRAPAWPTAKPNYE